MWVHGNELVISPILTQSHHTVDLNKLEKIVSIAKNNLLSKKILSDNHECEFWSMPAYLGSHFISQYYLLSRWLGLANTSMNNEYLLNLILSKQNKQEGFWLELDDQNLKVPNSIDASIFHYWALKVLRPEFPQKQLEIDTSLNLAKSYILKQGGAEKAVLFTKIIMALFGNYSWDNIIYVPSATYSDFISPYTVDKFSQWVIPHMRPIGYIRVHRISKTNLGSEFSLNELFIQTTTQYKSLKNILLNGSLTKLENLINNGNISFIDRYNSANWKKLVENNILQLQRPNGSWGGYTLATLFSLITIDHYYGHNFTNQIQTQFQKGLNFLEQMYFKTNLSSYMGVLDDGRYWDTALAIRALRENGLPDNQIQIAAQCLADTQQKNGAFPFGEGFEIYSDIDDTVETIIALKNLKLKNYDEKKALNFISNFQNKDYGWGTFDKNNTGTSFLKIFSTDFSDSAELFDISRPDVTGHALEALGLFTNKNAFNSQKIANAIQYLKKSRVRNLNTSWMSRWAVNYIFGTSAVITGLRAVGISKDNSVIQDAVKFLKRIQNSDGSFGESTDSYKNPLLVNSNSSVGTASQTAWAIMALCDANEAHSKTTRDAINYLMNQFEKNGETFKNQGNGFWTDPSVTGTGHPGLFYMVYPIYPFTWPLIAIGKYMRQICMDPQLSSHNFCQSYQ